MFNRCYTSIEIDNITYGGAEIGKIVCAHHEIWMAIYSYYSQRSLQARNSLQM